MHMVAQIKSMFDHKSFLLSFHMCFKYTSVYPRIIKCLVNSKSIRPSAVLTQRTVSYSSNYCRSAPGNSHSCVPYLKGQWPLPQDKWSSPGPSRPWCHRGVGRGRGPGTLTYICCHIVKESIENLCAVEQDRVAYKVFFLTEIQFRNVATQILWN